MRRMTGIWAVSLCAVAGCQGSAAQEPYDGVLAAAQRPAVSAPPTTAQAPEPEVTATEVDVPWTIALLSDAKTPLGKRAGKLMVVDGEPASPETIAAEDDLHIAVSHQPADAKPATQKACNGVVKSRS